LEILRKALKFAEKELAVRSKEEWMRVPNARLEEIGVGKIIKRHGGLSEALSNLGYLLDK